MVMPVTSVGSRAELSEELYKTCHASIPPPPLITTHVNFRDENGARELFSGRKPGTEAGDRPGAPHLHLRES